MAAMLKPASLNPFRFHFQELPLIDCTLIRPNLKDSRNFQFNLCLNRSKNGSVLPIVRAQSSPGMNCDLNSHFLAPWRIQQVSSALLKMGIRGVTVSDVRGFGAQGGSPERQAGSEFSEDKFVAKVKMEIVVSKDQVEAVIDKINEVARTGEIGDGKIFCKISGFLL
ncbi:Nitrogen regulatory protein P-II-like [Vitis vinifera]|uniref:Nitrogen regulatory protein P-II-like n=3 Tax=Vitis vinifera TaxID=29760 RepID=A0A438IY04_VITVI|nr:Nitrogen regulatory protein P-II-like [Vitis vinifera]